MKSNASLVYSFFLVVGDVVAIILSFVAAFIIRANSGIQVVHPIAGTTYIGIVTSLLPLWILVFSLIGLYNANIYERRFAECGRLFIGSFVGVLTMVFWDYMSLQNIFPAKLVPIYGFGLALYCSYASVTLPVLFAPLCSPTGKGSRELQSSEIRP